MDLALSAEHEQLREVVARFARDEVAPVIADHYRRGEFPLELVRRMGEMGLFGLPIPEEYGGMGGDYVALCVAIEELARVDSSIAITLEAGVSLGAMPILRFGTPEQKATLAAEAGGRGDARRLRPHGGRQRIGCRQRAHHRRRRRRPLGRSTGRSRSSPTRARPSPAWSPSPP